MRWFNSIIDSVDMNLSKIWERVKGQMTLVDHSPLGCKELDMTYSLNSNNNNKSLVGATYHEIPQNWKINLLRLFLFKNLIVLLYTKEIEIYETLYK